MIHVGYPIGGNEMLRRAVDAMADEIRRRYGIGDASQPGASPSDAAPPDRD